MELYIESGSEILVPREQTKKRFRKPNSPQIDLTSAQIQIICESHHYGLVNTQPNYLISKNNLQLNFELATFHTKTEGIDLFSYFFFTRTVWILFIRHVLSLSILALLIKINYMKFIHPTQNLNLNFLVPKTACSPRKCLLLINFLITL